MKRIPFTKTIDTSWTLKLRNVSLLILMFLLFWCSSALAVIQIPGFETPSDPITITSGTWTAGVDSFGNVRSLKSTSADFGAGQNYVYYAGPLISTGYNVTWGPREWGVGSALIEAPSFTQISQFRVNDSTVYTKVRKGDIGYESIITLSGSDQGATLGMTNIFSLPGYLWSLFGLSYYFDIDVVDDQNSDNDLAGIRNNLPGYWFTNDSVSDFVNLPFRWEEYYKNIDDIYRFYFGQAAIDSAILKAFQKGDFLLDGSHAGYPSNNSIPDDWELLFMVENPSRFLDPVITVTKDGVRIDEGGINIVVPEPSTIILFAVAIAGLGVFRLFGKASRRA